jgi:hypothetical protein
MVRLWTVGCRLLAEQHYRGSAKSVAITGVKYKGGLDFATKGAMSRDHTKLRVFTTAERLAVEIHRSLSPVPTIPP